jgi:hypothetical protein
MKTPLQTPNFGAGNESGRISPASRSFAGTNCRNQQSSCTLWCPVFSSHNPGSWKGTAALSYLAQSLGLHRSKTPGCNHYLLHFRIASPLPTIQSRITRAHSLHSCPTSVPISRSQAPHSRPSRSAFRSGTARLTRSLEHVPVSRQDHRPILGPSQPGR